MEGDDRRQCVSDSDREIHDMRRLLKKLCNAIHPAFYVVIDTNTITTEGNVIIQTEDGQNLNQG